MATFDQNYLAMYILNIMHPASELYCNTTPLANLRTKFFGLRYICYN